VFPPQFEYGPNDGFQLQGPPGFQVLQHGCLVLADFLRSGDALVDGDGQLRPIRKPTASTSSMTFRSSWRVQGSARIAAMVAPVSALIGLKAVFPSSLVQISPRICVVMGQRKPALMSACEMARQRPERLPSGSPMEKRSPDTCRTTPGSASSVEQ
jgi:hypothetical protein